MVVAIAVASIAATIILSLLSSSLGVMDTNRHKKAAAALAEEKLVELTNFPDLYGWPPLTNADVGVLKEISPPPGDPLKTRAFAAPEAMPLDKKSNQRESSFYEDFSWEAYAALPYENAGYVNVVVVVRLEPGPSKRFLALTSTVRRSLLEGRFQ